MLHEFAARGYVAISPQYRFCPKDPFPAQVHDVKAAVRWLKAHAKERTRSTPTASAPSGFSAGGHLSLMLGRDRPGRRPRGGRRGRRPRARIQAVVNYFGPTDLAASDIPDVSKPLVRDFLGGPRPRSPTLAAKASPLGLTSRRDDAPILTFQGTKDPLVPHTQADRSSPTP